MFAREKVDDAPPRAPISRLNDSRFIIFIVVIIIIVVVVSSASATAASVKRLKHRCKTARASELVCYVVGYRAPAAAAHICDTERR